jgi:hypothetical protein
MKASNCSEISTVNALTIRIVQPCEVTVFDARPADHHYRDAGRPVGDYLRSLLARHEDGAPQASDVYDQPK